MNKALLSLPALSYLILGAHSLRGSDLLQLVMWLVLLVVVLFCRRDSIRYFLAGTLAVGAVIWVDAALSIMRFRLFMDEPYIRLVMIMGAVFLLMAGAICFLFSNRGREVFYK